MVDVKSISRIGFGSYRTVTSNPEHKKALNHALISGCNIIDTASNYAYGDSEKLVGEILKENNTDSVFVVTKSGYITGNDHERINTLLSPEIAEKYVHNIENNFFYCIHPDYLRIQVKQSLARLNRTYIDCFLLHNPEYLFTVFSDSEVIYQEIKEAFEFLESLAKEGIIRYYGISSNTLPFPAVKNETFSLTRIIQIAKSIDADNKFKFIQFPFNYFENQAYSSIHEDSKSLISLAKENNLITMGNRPLNCNTENGFVRLTAYDGLRSNLNLEKDTEFFNELVDMLNKQLKCIDDSMDIYEIEIIAHLKDNWFKIGNPESVSALFTDYLNPFVNYIYSDAIPELVASKLESFKDLCIKYSKLLITDNADRVLRNSETLQKINSDKIQISACKYGLECGLDHVLVGMRSVNYVEDMKSIFL